MRLSSPADSLGGAPYLLLLPEPEGKYRVAGIRVEISSEDFVGKDGAGKRIHFYVTGSRIASKLIARQAAR